MADERETETKSQSESERERVARLWRSVFLPGASIGLPELAKFRQSKVFHIDPATTLAWLSHVVYAQEKERRQSLLAVAGFRERRHFGHQELHWSQISPVDDLDCHLVIFRGTSDLRHWVFNVNTLLTQWPEGGKVHGGFARAYEKIAEPLNAAMEADAPKKLYFAGHSLGGALALLASTKHRADAVYTFGCPRPGNPSFAERVAQVPVFRVVHNQDIVTTLPYEIEFLNDFAYKHAGRPVHLRPDQPLTIDEAKFLPRSRQSWWEALHAILEGDRTGEPLPALLDHAPGRYVTALQDAAKR